MILRRHRHHHRGPGRSQRRAYGAARSGRRRRTAAAVRAQALPYVADLSQPAGAWRRRPATRLRRRAAAGAGGCGHTGAVPRSVSRKPGARSCLRTLAATPSFGSPFLGTGERPTIQVEVLDLGRLRDSSASIVPVMQCWRWPFWSWHGLAAPGAHRGGIRPAGARGGQDRREPRAAGVRLAVPHVEQFREQAGSGHDRGCQRQSPALWSFQSGRG